MELSLPACPDSGSLHVSLFGHQSGKQRYRCRACKKPGGTTQSRTAPTRAARR